MNMNVGVAKIFGLKLQLAVAATQKTERGLHRFFHHVPDLSGESDIAFSRVTRRFDVQDFAPHRRVGETGHDPGLIRSQFGVVSVTRWPESFGHEFRAN